MEAISAQNKECLQVIEQLKTVQQDREALQQEMDKGKVYKLEQEVKTL